MSNLRFGSNAFFLLLGDGAIFFASLWVALTVRHFAIPQSTFYAEHVYPFTVLFILWVVIFFIAGLYDEELLTVKRSLADILFVTQSAGAAAAIGLFYLVPFFDLTPKTNLALFLVIFSVAVWWWRRYFFHSLRPIAKDVILIGDLPNLQEVFSEKNFHGFTVITTLPWEELNAVRDYPTNTLVLVNYRDELFKAHTTAIHELMFSDYQVIDSNKISERIFGRVDINQISDEWFIKKISQPNRLFVFTKRCIDIAAAIALLSVLALLLPGIILWMVIEEKKIDLFFIHARAGKYGKPFTMYKLRSMRVKDGSSWDGDNHTQITHLGKIIRALRIDELPQAVNLLRGDVSLVGPRAILESEQEEMESLLGSYKLRLFAKPGITGWAQIKQKHAPMNTEEAQERLGYDLYYLEHQSVLFDILIMLKTIKTIILKAGIR